MAEEPSGRWLWWTVGGVIVLIAAASKDFWPTLWIFGAAEIAAYALIPLIRNGQTSFQARDLVADILTPRVKIGKPMWWPDEDEPSPEALKTRTTFPHGIPNE